MRSLCPILIALLPTTALACKCATATLAQLRVENDRIALVEVVEVGAEFDGSTNFTSKLATIRNVRLRIVESFTGSWAPEATVTETLRVEGYEIDCPLGYHPGERFILFLGNDQTFVTVCDTRPADQALLERLRTR
jgi:hypothetical protein